MFRMFTPLTSSQNPHKLVRFRAVWSVDGKVWEPVLGISIGDGGMRVIGRCDLFAGDTLQVRASLGTCVVSADAVVTDCRSMMYLEAPAYECGLRFVAMSAENAAALQQFCASNAVDTLMGTDALEQMFPGARAAVARELRAHDRLEKDDFDIDYRGLTAIEGRPWHEMIVRSRVVRQNDVVDLATRLLYDQAVRDLIIVEATGE